MIDGFDWLEVRLLFILWAICISTVYNSNFGKDAMRVLRYRFDRRMQTKNRRIILIDSIYKLPNILKIEFTKFDTFDSNLIFTISIEYIRINKLIDNNIHLCPIDIICKFTNISNLTNHIL